MTSPSPTSGKAGPAALVTGAARRLGRAIALALAEDGFDLAIHHNRSADEAAALAADIQAMGRRTVILRADLAKPERMASLVEEAHATLGPLSLLVNNASVLAKDSLSTMTLRSWRTITDVNLTSQIVLMQAFASQPDLPAHASIINMLDQQMSAPSPRFFSYAVAKIGLEGATRLAAFELAPRIRVNGIAPGLVLRSGAQTDETYRDVQGRMPLGEGLGSEDIVRAVRYLLASPHVTGEVMIVDSGQRLIGPGNTRFLRAGE
ncbi:MAG: SDR family oxidoreductase [Alphaproteobacteria bacterium]